ncbi:MAG: hypothetical protein ACOVNL_11135 [Prochlorococcaceae cyanobacterium]
MAAGFPFALAGSRRRRPAFVLLLALPFLLGGCALAGRGVSEAGRQRCRSQAAAAPLPLRPWKELRCLPDIDRRLAAEAEQERLARQRAQRERQQQLALCRRQRTALIEAINAWRRTEQELADLRLERYRPLPPPPPIDEEREQRYRPEDRELDRERYENDLATWRQEESERRARWQARRQARQEELRQRQRRERETLRQLQPAVLQGERLDEAAIARHTHCPEATPPAGGAA